MPALKDKYGRYAVVTGASDGIGRELARRLAEAGLHLVVAARREEALAQLADEWRARYGIDVRVCATDLSQREGVAELIAATRSLDVGLLVAAAGYGTSGPYRGQRTTPLPRRTCSRSRKRSTSSSAPMVSTSWHRPRDRCAAASVRVLR